ncbi:MAG: hypothetical protein GY775_14810 [Candidatus Scalindua sp.]|nr:hypothetical protein [Candidatus Scalindua sp.]
MSDLSAWAEHIKDPLVLVGFTFMLLAGIITTLLKSKILHLSKTASERILKQVLLYGFIIGIIVIVSGFVVAFIKTTKEENVQTDSVTIKQKTEGDQSPAIDSVSGDVNITYENK